MQRITISIDEALAQAFDGFLAGRGYTNRSEGVRDLVREAVEAHGGEAADEGWCVAVLSFVYDPATRALAQRLAALSQANHDLVAASTAMPLDHHDTLVSLMLKGSTREVCAFADSVRAERGVRFGRLNRVGVQPHDAHEHVGDHAHAGHAHLSPRLP